MSVTLNVSALKTRESTSDPWQGTVVKSDAILDAGTITYDGTETYTAGTVGEELVEQRNTLNTKADEESLALRRSGSTNTEAQIATGTYFYLDGTLKRAIATIAQNAPFTAQNCETVSDGALNEPITYLVDYHNLNISVDAGGYNFYDLASDSPFQTAISKGYHPIGAYINNDSLAISADVQYFNNNWYLVFRNWYSNARTVNNAAIVFNKI